MASVTFWSVPPTWQAVLEEHTSTPGALRDFLPLRQPCCRRPTDPGALSATWLLSKCQPTLFRPHIVESSTKLAPSRAGQDPDRGSGSGTGPGCLKNAKGPDK